MSDSELRELDAWIADRIMGLVEKPVGECTVANEDFCVHDRVLIYQGEKRCLAPFQPSSDPAAAMQVLEKCIKRNSKIHISERMPGKFCVYNEIGGLIIGEADTLPLAVAKFAKQLFSS